jgi:oligopeptide/dipeptide ABC transporter ATP-binding protein
MTPPPGCHFHPRCPYAVARCKTEAPALREVEPGHQVACHLR